jgi:hypothetical protein
MNTTDYRRNAEDCLRLAERASPEARVVLLMMAEAWLRLVQYREHDAVKCEIEPPVRAIAGEVANNAPDRTALRATAA